MPATRRVPGRASARGGADERAPLPAGLPKLRAILQHVRTFAEPSAALRGG